MMRTGDPAFDPAGQRQGFLGAALWYGLALIACLSVFGLNGVPLFYYDTGGYIIQGTTALEQLGLVERAVPAGDGTGAGSAPAADDKTVNASRSAVFSIVIGGLAWADILEILVLINTFAVLIAIWLPMRIAVRTYGPPVPPALLVALPLIVAAAGALPFFTAFLMPDTFAAILLLCIGTLTVFSREMRVWEMLLLLALGSFAAVSHPSHLAIAALLVPVSLVVALALDRRRWWVPPLLVSLIVGLGIAERMAFKLAAEKVTSSEVLYHPYLTARLVQDGPGMAYLEAHCPNPEITTCLLHEALSWSENPRRLTASHITFETSHELGSFRRMPPPNQKRVADAQVSFFFDVLAWSPVSTVSALLGNALAQMNMYSVDMTLQKDEVVWRMSDKSGLSSGAFEHGRLTRDRTWVDSLTPLHGLLYWLSFGLLLVLLIVPRRVPVALKALTIVVFGGILANAMVCGGISQPATRYGARVIWLLPVMATILLLFARRPRPADGKV